MELFLVSFTSINVLLFLGCAGAQQESIRAVAKIRSDGPVSGTIHFTQTGEDGPVVVEVNVSGLRPGAHGLHGHKGGQANCPTEAEHFNPYNHPHGARQDQLRHLGDFGNIYADANGYVNTRFTDHMISLVGPRSIVGIGMVIHRDIDDLGRGGNADSVINGNAGPVIACGTIHYE